MSEQQASLAQGEQPATSGKGVGSIPACGSNLTTWPLWPVIYPARNFTYATHLVWGRPVCPQCGCSKRPHVAYSQVHSVGDRGPGARRFQAHCNYCKLRWNTE